MTTRTLRRLASSLAVLALAALPRAARSQDVQCDPGDKEVMDLRFEGNHAFSGDELSLRVNTTESSWARRKLRFFGARRCLDSNELPRDVYRLRVLYHNAGFYDAQVDTTVTPLGPNAVRVTFRIDEGKPIIVDSLGVEGLDSVPVRGRVLAKLWSAPGKRFDQGRLQADMDSIVSRLQNNGYPLASIIRNYDLRRDSLLVRVTLTALPGPRARFGHIAIADTAVDEKHRREIDDRSIDRLLGFAPGDLYRNDAIVDAQRNLYQTGAFRHVEIGWDTTAGAAPNVAGGTAALESAGADTTIDLQVRVREDYMRQLNGEAGWATLDCGRLRAQYVDKDFFGDARRLEFTGQATKIGFGYPLQSPAVRRSICPTLLKDAPGLSDTLNYYFGATLRQPTLFGPNASPVLTLYRERRSEYKAYLRNTLVGGDASLNRNLGRLTTPIRLGYTLEYGKTSAEPAVLCAVFQRCTEELRQAITGEAKFYAVASTAITRSRVDNPLAPTRGSVARLELRGSDRFIGSDPSQRFVKGVGDAAFYLPGGWGNVFAMRFRGGVIFGGTRIGDTLTPPPPQERLYAGGATTVRGYQQNELGSLIYITKGYEEDRTSVPGKVIYVANPGTVDSESVDRTVPTGGTAMVIANFEYRVRDPFFPDLLQYTFFTDLGDVWERGKGKAFGFGSLARTPGVGVRVFSPLGPIQVNVGYNPTRLPAGPAFYEQRVKENDSYKAPLYCVSPGNGLAIDTAAAPPAQAAGQCPATYQPPAPKNWLGRLTLTFSIGPDF